jgi:sporulation protein YlmC with PRC-barrel domain
MRLNQMVAGLVMLMLLGSTTLGANAKQALLSNLPETSNTIADYYKQDVYDTQDNKLGSVSDVLLDKSGRVSAVILGVGGLLGIGEKDVAVPFAALQLKEKNGNRYLVVDANKDTLSAAPGYVYDHTKRAWLPASTKQPG